MTASLWHLFGNVEIEISEAEISSQLQNLDPSKNRRNDALLPILLNKTFDTISLSLNNLFKHIKRLHIDFKNIKRKIENLSPIFKDDDRKKVENYRS